mmetsp:Transcript_1734/g.4903  ORF Transcript_1734/g.4903 Transcript_1734/m.4903 type:complete len:241 (-) Transcript_1734:1108-1830(-)
MIHSEATTAFFCGEVSRRPSSRLATSGARLWSWMLMFRKLAAMMSLITLRSAGWMNFRPASIRLSVATSTISVSSKSCEAGHLGLTCQSQKTTGSLEGASVCARSAGCPMSSRASCGGSVAVCSAGWPMGTCGPPSPRAGCLFVVCLAARSSGCDVGASVTVRSGGCPTSAARVAAPNVGCDPVPNVGASVAVRSAGCPMSGGSTAVRSGRWPISSVTSSKVAAPNVGGSVAVRSAGCPM